MNSFVHFLTVALLGFMLLFIYFPMNISGAKDIVTYRPYIMLAFSVNAVMILSEFLVAYGKSLMQLFRR